MSLIITVPYTIVVDSGVHQSGIHEGAPKEGPWAEVKFRCYWDDRFILCTELMGTWTVAGRTVIRTPAFVYPAAPQLFCTDIVDISPMGKPIIPRLLTLPWLSRQLATVTARFSIPGYTQDGSDQSGRAYTEISINTSGEFLTLPNTTYYFADGTPTGTPIGFMMPQIDFTISRHKMPFIPDAEMALMCGKVNGSPFAISRSFTAETGTALFMPGSVQPDGNVQAFFYEVGYPFSYVVEYHFLYRPIPWNFYLHPNRTSGFQIVTDGNGAPPYQSGDFTTLP